VVLITSGSHGLGLAIASSFARRQDARFAATAERTASRVYAAVAAGRAEIAITPQAWLSALTAGLLPESTQFAAGLVNYFMLPASPNTRHPHEFD
jgi:NAD(P)-dependent dehydrogenase (short-subunit alcohol dehydrogenase family)